MNRFRTVTRQALRPKGYLVQCANCPDPCPHQNHYTGSGGCVVPAHKCEKFKALKFEGDGEIRKQNRGRFYGSTHERLSATDIERVMARGQSDVAELRRQVPFVIRHDGGRRSIFYADLVGTLSPGASRYTHRIYEPKGMKSEIYLLKRFAVIALYPDVEFVEVI